MDRANEQYTKAPDLRTRDGQLQFLDYHAPDETQAKSHSIVNRATQDYWQEVANAIPDGPGKTRALHAVQRARMEMNCAIANHGA
jgi:hypothetical protein